MKRVVSKYLIIIVLVISNFGLSAQTITDSAELLTLQKAVEIALVNNYDIKIANAELGKAKNNNSIGNAGLLPSVNVNAGAEYSNKDTEMEFMNEGSPVLSVDNAKSMSYNANARLNYTLFDGFGNIYTYKKLKSADELQETLFRRQMEATMVQVAERYYQVCRAGQNYSLAKESMRISTERHQKAMDKKAYGQGTQLDILNAEVDMNNDSAMVLQTEQMLIRSIKDLNIVLGMPVANLYEVEDSVTYRDDFTADEVISAALMNNAAFMAQQQQERISGLDAKITDAKKYPTLTAYGQYSYTRLDKDAGMFLYSQEIGPSAGLSLTFNVFNGHQQRTREKNARLDMISQQERTMKVKSEIERDAANAYTDYTYKRRTVDLQESSLKQAKLNFEKTQEMFQLGRVTSIEFRTAQQNLLMVAAQYSDAQYNAKVAEFYLLQLMGELVN